MSISEFLDFMPDTITINAWVSRDGSGAPTYSSTTLSYSARIEMKNHRIVNRAGREVLAKGRIFLGTTTAPDIKDKVTLPSQYKPTNPPILDVNIEPDENGDHHVVLEI